MAFGNNNTKMYEISNLLFVIANPVEPKLEYSLKIARTQHKQLISWSRNAECSRYILDCMMVARSWL